MKYEKTFDAVTGSLIFGAVLSALNAGIYLVAALINAIIIAIAGV